MLPPDLRETQRSPYYLVPSINQGQCGSKSDHISNSLTNKIYVVARGSSSVTVIDGATNSTLTLPVGRTPQHVAVDSITNKIYVTNSGDNTVTVIDGATNSTSTIATGASSPSSLCINPATNKIYVGNLGGSSVRFRLLRGYLLWRQLERCRETNRPVTIPLPPPHEQGKGILSNIMQPATKLTLPEQVASQARFIVDNLVTTDYQHKDNIDVDRGIYECDCNGFAAFVLQRAAPDHFAPIPKETTQPRPRAFEYYVFFSSLDATPVAGWHNIQLLKDARRGDMLAWRFPTVEKGHDTGHVVFVADTPKLLDNGSYAVLVYDSAATPHFEDTRATGTTGIGSGFINFKVDQAGKPISFQFAPPSTTSFETLPIAIGRIEPLS